MLRKGLDSLLLRIAVALVQFAQLPPDLVHVAAVFRLLNVIVISFLRKSVNLCELL